MKKLSTTKLALAVKTKRKEKLLTKEDLGKLTGINRIMIGRIEKEDFIPSITQLESLSSILGLDITEMFMESEENRSFIALRSEALSDSEKQGVDTLFSMMLAIRQQILIRSRLENE